MMHSRNPLIGIATNTISIYDGLAQVNATHVRDVKAVREFAGGDVILIPSESSPADSAHILSHLDGLVLNGGRGNVEPHHFGGEKFPPDEPIDPARDATTLSLVLQCVELGMPVFGICRGFQELNVALGGSLIYRVHLVEGKLDHRMPRHDGVTEKEAFQLRHRVELTPNGYLADLVGLDSLQVNSLHGQGIDVLAEGLAVEAVSEDGIIEAVRIISHPSFAIGVQWHAEYQPSAAHNLLNRRLYEAFGEAAADYAACKRRSLNLNG